MKKGKEVMEKAASKPKTKKTETKFYVEFQGRQVSREAIKNMFYTEWEKDRKRSEIKTLNIYFKPEENTAYCVVNDDVTVIIPLL